MPGLTSVNGPWFDPEEGRVLTPQMVASAILAAAAAAWMIVAFQGIIARDSGRIDKNTDVRVEAPYRALVLCARRHPVTQVRDWYVSQWEHSDFSHERTRPSVDPIATLDTVWRTYQYVETGGTDQWVRSNASRTRTYYFMAQTVSAPWTDADSLRSPLPDFFNPKCPPA